jgi:protein transport protein SEC61 subunit gamma-like protein
LKPLKDDKDNKNIIDKAWDVQHKIESRQKRIGKGKYGRVLKMARKPTDEEYSKTSKITGAGIVIIGGIGFLVWLIAKEVAPWIAGMLGWI